MLTEIDYGSLEFICLGMRKIDRDEIYNTRENDNPLQLAFEAHYTFKNKGRGRVAWHNGKPCAVVALTESWPGHWEISMFGTDDLPKAGIEMIRWIRNEISDIFKISAGRRLQCHSREGHPEAHTMIKALGGKPDGPWKEAYGKDGSRYQLYVWLRGVNDQFMDAGYVRADKDQAA